MAFFPSNLELSFSLNDEKIHLFFCKSQFFRYISLVDCFLEAINI